MSTKLVVLNEDTLVTLGDFSDYHIWLALVGLVVAGREGGREAGMREPSR